ncbi:tyrosine-type recombinase/integrase [Archangium minus]|uniref:tyrosine-type recombinase/integrase n=1 Tax=Archangium minus TaxID=83450 RepID=UPI0037C17CD9
MDVRSTEAGRAEGDGALHILRHTFCSHLAMRGVPPLSPKELAGHRSLRTTMQYMHLGKGRSTAPSRCWSRVRMRLQLGDILETRRSLEKHRGRKPLRFQRLPAPIEVSPTGFEPVLPA